MQGLHSEPVKPSDKIYFPNVRDMCSELDLCHGFAAAAQKFFLWGRREPGP
jgi:hypothetical protein